MHSARNDTLTFFCKLGPYYDTQLDRFKANLAVAQNTTNTKYVDKPFYYRVNTIVYTRGLDHVYKQKQKLDDELERIQADRHYERLHCTGLFMRTIGIHCSHRLEGMDTLSTAAFDEFWIIPSTSAQSPARQRLLEPALRLSKRNVRIARLHAAGTGSTIGVRNTIGAELHNPNNPYLVEDEAT